LADERRRYLAQQAELGGTEIILGRPRARELEQERSMPPERSPAPGGADTSEVPKWKKGAPPVPGPGLAVLSPTPAIFWPAMFVSLTLFFVTTGPLNAAMANVLPAALRGRGFAVNTMAIHLFGDVLSPTLIGVASDRIGLRTPILVASMLMGLAGAVLLAGRRALVRDLEAAA